MSSHNLPSRQASFSYPGDSAVTIDEAGLGRHALLFVEQKPKDAERNPEAETETKPAVGGEGDSEDEMTPR